MTIGFALALGVPCPGCGSPMEQTSPVDAQAITLRCPVCAAGPVPPVSMGYPRDSAPLRTDEIPPYPTDGRRYCWAGRWVLARDWSYLAPTRDAGVRG